MGRERKKWVAWTAAAGLLGVSALVWTVLRPWDPDMSDAPFSERVSFSAGREDGFGPNTFHLFYQRCEGDLTPHVDVSEVVEGERLSWDDLPGVMQGDQAEWLVGRRNRGGSEGPTGAETYEGALPPPREASLEVIVRPHESEPVVVSGLQIGDMPSGESGEVLTADGSVLDRDEWEQGTPEKCPVGHTVGG